MTDHSHDPQHDPKHEVDADIDKGAIVRTGIQLVVVTVVSAAVMWPLLKGLDALEAGKDAPKTAMQAQRDALDRRPFPEPALQPSPAADMRAMRQAQDAILDSYGWVDPSHTVARVPIERAIEMLAAKSATVQPVVTEPAAANAP